MQVKRQKIKTLERHETVKRISTAPSRRTCDIRFVVACLFAIMNLHGAARFARAEENDPRRTARMTPVVRVFRECSPAVVNLSTTTVVSVQRPSGLDRMIEDIFDLPPSRPRSFKSHSVGSGFVIHSDGYVVTNAHVIERATEIRVTFSDGTELPAEEVARDRANDLAVLKVDAPSPLPFLKLGRSDDLMPGESVIAIGNPLGFQHTITTGIISALDRELRFSRDLAYTGLIQTDAPINPGNSGGPLLNVLGELIGINTAIRGDAQNIGFAIPIDQLHDLLPSMLDIQRLRRVEFGIHFDSAKSSTSPKGVVIKSIDANSPADKAGLLAGDTILAIEGKATPDFMEAFSLLRGIELGRAIKLDVLRGDRSRKTFEVRMLDIPRLDSAEIMLRHFGIQVRELSREDMQQLRLRRPLGLFIEVVQPSTEAAGAGIREGDIVTMFGRWPVTSLSALGQLIKQVNPNDRIPIQVLRIQDDVVTRAEIVLRARE